MSWKRLKPDILYWRWSKTGRKIAIPDMKTPELIGAFKCLQKLRIRFLTDSERYQYSRWCLEEIEIELNKREDIGEYL